MRTTLSKLMSSTGYARIAMAPDGMGGGDGDIEDNSDDFFDDGIPDSDDGMGSGFGGDDEINVETDPDLQDFWNTDDDDENSETPEQRSERLRNEEKEMAAALQAGLDSFTLADDLIPDDFNPADPSQLRSVMSNAI